MKKIFKSSIVLILFSASILIFQYACKKESNAQSSTLTKDQILVAKTWRVDKLHHVISGQYSSYTSGSSNTTGIDYDKLKFTFLANGTGKYIDQTGTSNDITWSFTTTDKRTMEINVVGQFKNTWEMVEIQGNYLHASVNLTLSGNSNNIETFRLIQVP